jgi:hypothetical protein
MREVADVKFDAYRREQPHEHWAVIEKNHREVNFALSVAKPKGLIPEHNGD